MLLLRDGVPEDEVPLRMWSKKGHACAFCSECMKTWWGLETFDDDEGDDRE